MADTIIFAPTGAARRQGVVADLPEPARRFLTRAIAPGTPLARSVDLETHGQSSASSRTVPPLTMTADQVLAPPGPAGPRLPARESLHT